MTITTPQARERFLTISDRLQDAMFSTQTAEIIDGIVQQFHLNDEKAGIVGKVAGWVLLGFLHPEDVAHEIQQQTAIPSQAATDIAKALDTKIFANLHDDLAAAYAPAPLPTEEHVTGPKMIQEVSPMPQPVAAGAATLAPQKSQILSALTSKSAAVQLSPISAGSQSGTATAKA